MKKARIIEILILIIVLSLFVGGILVFRQKTLVNPNTYTIVFKDIDSIVKGSPVRFMGMNIGHVVKLTRKDKYIICTIRVTEEDVKIPDGTRAKVAFNGLGGSKSVELFPPVENDKNAKGIVALESLRISDFVTVVQDLKDVCKIINEFMQSLDPDMLVEEVKKFTQNGMVDDMDYGIQKLTDAKENVDKKIDDTINSQNKILKMLDWFESFFEKSKK